jgi:hypothetical protein
LYITIHSQLDALDDFSKPIASSSAKQEQAHSPHVPNDAQNDEIFNNEFNVQLAQGMQELLKKLNLLNNVFFIYRN